MSRKNVLTLTGILGTSDGHGRLRLRLVDYLPGGGQSAKKDYSWKRLKEVLPTREFRATPYSLPKGGAPDDAGVRGECWIVIPGGRGGATAQRRGRLLTLAESLRGKEVEVEVVPKRYTFISQASHNRGAQVSGASLQLRTIEPVLEKKGGAAMPLLDGKL
jgi:hypothetical protein